MKNDIKAAIRHAEEIQTNRRLEEEKKARERGIAEDRRLAELAAVLEAEQKEIARKELSKLQYDIKHLFIWSASYECYQEENGIVWANNIIEARNAVLQMYMEKDYVATNSKRIQKLDSTIHVEEIDLTKNVIITGSYYE